MMRFYPNSTIAIAFLSAVVVVACIPIHSLVTKPSLSCSIIHDYVMAQSRDSIAPLVPERAKSLPRDSMVVLHGDDGVEVIQLFKHQRLYSGMGFSNFAIMDTRNALIPANFYGFAEKPVLDNDECQTFLVTTNAIFHLDAFTKGIGENGIPSLPKHTQEINFSNLDVKTPVEIICQGCVPVSILLERLNKLNPDGSRAVYLLYY